MVRSMDLTVDVVSGHSCLRMVVCIQSISPTGDRKVRLSRLRFIREARIAIGAEVLGGTRQLKLPNVGCPIDFDTHHTNFFYHRTQNSKVR